MFLSFFQRDSAWAQTWICEDVIMILRLEEKKKKKKKCLQDDKWVKSLLISSVSHPQWKVDRIKSYQLSACRSHSRQRAPGDWQLKGLDHETNAGKAATVLKKPPIHTCTLHRDAGMYTWFTAQTEQHACELAFLYACKCVCVCVFVSEPLTLWVSFSCPLRRGSSSS